MTLLKPINPCSSCLGLRWGNTGYVPANGTGTNGVLVIAEAAGEHEAQEGMPLVGKAGYFFWSNLQRAGIDRDGFREHNVLSCRPPNNKLAGMPYENEVITHCSGLLDQTIYAMQETCKQHSLTLVILTLGQIAFRRIMSRDLDPLALRSIMKEDYLAYPFWSETYQAWVIASDHPSFFMRGSTHLIPVMQFCAKRALEIAEKGLKIEEPTYLEGPLPETFTSWVADYTRHNLDSILSYDIETPYKQGKAEDKIAREDDVDFTILRVSFSYKPVEGPVRTVSVPWQAEFLPGIEKVFASKGPKCGWNNSNYDDPRIRVHTPINGDIYDGMVMWHILNSALPKGLGFVTPFYVQNTAMWKHLSASKPAFYNAKDAHMALLNVLGIIPDLQKANLWDVFENHVLRLNRALTYMTGVGVKRDEELRARAECDLSLLLDATEKKMESAIPEEARKFKVFKKTPPPEKRAGLVQVDGEGDFKQCPLCLSLLSGSIAQHFKSIGKKRIKTGEPENPCFGLKPVKTSLPTKLWAKPLPFKISSKGMQNYQQVLRHQAVVNRKENRITFDENAIIKLQKRYPQDPLYPLILEHREYQKLLSTYIGITQPGGVIRGGMRVGRDGRVHTTYTHNPSTLRLASQEPNLQNIPRPGGKDDLKTIIRNLVVAGDGYTFLARDYSGIEAVLVGYFALSPRYIRLSKIDVHSFYTAYALHELDGRVKAADLPDFDWPDARLIPHLAAIKKEFKADRNSLYKHLVHGANFFQGPAGAQEKILNETGIEFPISKIKRVMDIYFALFPEIKKWHHRIWAATEKDGFVRNPYGYVHRFYRVYSYEKIGGAWQKKPGVDANKVVAFLPQSTAAGIIKEAILRLYFDRFDEAGQFMRLQIHDEVFCEVPISLVDHVDAVMQEEMERPIKQLPLPTSYGMGEYLSILTEAKRGDRWGSMRGD